MATISGGGKLEKALRDLSSKVSKSATVEVGFPVGALYPDGKPVAMIAAIQEYGAPRAGIPPRPFFRTMIAKNSPQWPDEIATQLRVNDFDSEKALGAIGAEIAYELKQSIVETMSPPLSEVTLMLRMMRRKDPSLVVTGATVAEARARVAAGERASGVSTKPLVDTGAMLNSIKSTVK